MPTCSIVVPVYNRASLTRQCLRLLLSRSPSLDVEIIVVDDGSRDLTPQLLAGYGGLIRVVTHPTNLGFAAACNDGALIATGQYLVFLNNDTMPERGWLDELVAYAEAHPRAAVVGSKLLYPDGTIQHAGLVIAQNGLPSPLYSGFPGDHPAVNVSRQFQAVTGACMLVRRHAFEAVGGFDTAFHNFYDDVDLCLRLGEQGHETHYCHTSVLVHLQAQSRGRSWATSDPFKDGEAAMRLFTLRWSGTVRRDDIDYYVRDGLLTFETSLPYPLQMSVSPLLGLVDADERDRTSAGMLGERVRQVYDLVQERTALEARLRDLEFHLQATGTGTGVVQPRSWPELRTGASLFAVRDFIAGLYLTGQGIEIGALHSPLGVGDAGTVRYVDRVAVAELRRLYPELDDLPLVDPDIIDDGEHLTTLADASQDFVIGNHYLEHCQDPIGAIKTILRVLKPGGVAYMAVPDKRFTFDHRRPITSLDHLVRDHESGPSWSKHDHFEEWVALGEDISTKDMTVEQLLAMDYSIHFHVWTQFDLLEFFAFIAKQYDLPFTLELVMLNIVEVIFVLRKHA